MPRRGIGDKSIKEIAAAAKDEKISPYEVVIKALKGSSIGNIKAAQKATLKSFVEL